MKPDCMIKTSILKILVKKFTPTELFAAANKPISDIYKKKLAELLDHLELFLWA